LRLNFEDCSLEKIVNTPDWDSLEVVTSSSIVGVQIGSINQMSASF